MTDPDKPHDRIAVRSQYEFPRRRRPRSSRFARYAAALVCALAVGLVVGLESRGDRDRPAAGRRLELRPTAAFPAATATLTVAHPDDAGNRALTLAVRGLPPTPAQTYYELVLVAKSRVAASLGRFGLRSSSQTTVSLNVPYPLRDFDGWAVIREREGREESQPLVVLTSS
jgi:hypothetical protein